MKITVLPFCDTVYVEDGTVCGSGPFFAEPVCDGYFFGKKHGPSLFRSFSTVERSLLTEWPLPVIVT